MEVGSRHNPFDVVIIGGGINGCGIARDCALRGLSVAVFEKNDFSTGATWASSGMIHGGLRYLMNDPDVTRLSCIDSGHIQKIAPHLIFRIPFIMPFVETDRRARLLLEMADVYFETYDRYAPAKGGLPHTRLTGDELRTLEPGVSDMVIGAVTTDEWGIDAARLTVANALDASRRGASIHNYHEVVGLLRGVDGDCLGARVHDRIGGSTKEVFGRITFNATGPWAGAFAAGHDVEGITLRPAKGIHLVYAGRISNYAIVSQAIDGRQIFMVPHQNTTLVGTTDDDYYGNLDDIPVLHDEVEYLLQGMEKTYPEIRRFRMVGTTVGCRPTLHAYGKYEDDLSRDYRVFDHTEHGCPGFMSIGGGKLASYRIMCEHATDAIVEKLQMPLHEHPCRTHVEALPGGEPFDRDFAPWVEAGVSRTTADRILFRHGSEASAILALLQKHPEMARVVDPSEPVIEAELRYVIREEMVGTLDDARRRVRLGCGADRGLRSGLLAAQIFAEEKGYSMRAVPDIAAHYHALRFRQREAVLRGTQLAQEELGQMWLEASGLMRRHHVVSMAK